MKECSREFLGLWASQVLQAGMPMFDVVENGNLTHARNAVSQESSASKSPLLEGCGAYNHPILVSLEV